MIPILVPLFISAFRRADELATAMECRLYRGDVGRTRMRQLKIARVDVCALLVGCGFVRSCYYTQAFWPLNRVIMENCGIA